MKSGDLVGRYTLDTTMGEIRCDLFPHLTYHNKDRCRVNDVMVSSGDLLCDVLVSDLRQKMVVRGNVREFSLNLRTEEEFLQAFQSTGFHRILDVAGVPMVVRGTRLFNVYSWVATLSGAKISTPWGTESGASAFNRVWDIVHLLEGPEPDTSHGPINVMTRVLLGEGRVVTLPDPIWRH